MANKVWHLPMPNDQERFDIIKSMLDFQRKNSSWFTDADVCHYVKMLLENGTVLISAGAMQLYTSNSSSFWIQNCSGGVISNQAIVNSMVNHQPLPSGTPYLQSKINRSVLTWEHMVPVCEIIKLIKQLYDANQFSLHVFRQIKDSFGYVCIVTKAEDGLLNAYKNSMPKQLSLESNFMERYKAVGVNVA